MFLVFDVGGTFIKYAYMKVDGTMFFKDKVSTPCGRGEGVEDFLECLEEIFRTCKKNHTIEGIAVSLPGQIDVEKGIVYGGGGLTYLDKVCLGDLLSKRCDNVPVALENDGKCAALCEVYHGNAVDCMDACVLVFGTGIGGGIVRDRKVVHGRHILAGEISFCFDDIDRSRIDEIVSTFDLRDELREDYLKKMNYIWGNISSTVGVIHQVAWAKGLDPNTLTGEDVYAFIDKNDQTVVDIVEDWYFRIAKYCCNMYVILDPDIILIGGGISAQPRFVEGIQKYVKKLAIVNPVYDKIKVDVCKHRNSSNLLGALDNFKQIYRLEDKA